MIDHLDAVLKATLDDTSMAPALQALLDADVSFITPDGGYVPDQETINLFLYETRENRELRDPVPIVDKHKGRSLRTRPRVRVDCSYLVTAWSKKSGSDKVAAEHGMLGQAFNWLSRFPVIPDQYVQAGGLAPQLYAPPTMVAQMDGAKSAGEFWHALGIPPRPYFNLVVTICMDLEQSVEESIVTTISSRYYPAGAPAAADELITIGGTVRNAGGDPVADAWVRLESPVPAQAQTQVTDAVGRFVFERVSRGTGYTLRARASGYREAAPPPIDVPSTTGEYDLQLTV